MMGKKDKDSTPRESLASPARARTTDPAPTTNVPFQSQPVPARGDDNMRRSVDSLNPPKKTSMWKSVKNATKTSSSVDYSNSTISAPLPDPAARTLPPPKPARAGSIGHATRDDPFRSESPNFGRSNTPDADDSSRKSLDSHGQPKKSSVSHHCRCLLYQLI